MMAKESVRKIKFDITYPPFTASINTGMKNIERSRTLDVIFGSDKINMKFRKVDVALTNPDRAKSRLNQIKY